MNTPTVNNLEQIPAALQWLVNEFAELRQNIALSQTPTPTPAPEEFITRKEAAEKLHISLNTLDTYAKDGKVKAYRLGNRVLYKSNEITSALQAMKTTIAA